jgi:hypothetical protein
VRSAGSGGAGTRLLKVGHRAPPAQRSGRTVPIADRNPVVERLATGSIHTRTSSRLVLGEGQVVASQDARRLAGGDLSTTPARVGGVDQAAPVVDDERLPAAVSTSARSTSVRLMTPVRR